jgi:VWFA-related protein
MNVPEERFAMRPLYLLFMESPLRRPCLFFASFMLAGLAASPLTAQTQGPLIKTSAQAVAVDVVVTKGSDQPVLSLVKGDFQVLEDGKPQAIDLFEEHTTPANAPAVALPQLPPHVYSNQPIASQADAVNLLLIDSLNTSGPDQQYVHKQIVDLIKNIKPGTRIAIFTLNTRLRLLQGFTADNALLMAAVDSKAAAPGTTIASRSRDDDLRDKEELSIAGEMSNTGGADSEAPLQSIARSQANLSATQAGQRSTITLAALQQLARALAGIPGRKNLIWFASSFPISIFPDGPNRQTLANGKEIEPAVRETANLLTQAKVAVYPVSAQGIVTDTTMNAESAGQPNGADFERAPNQQTAANTANTGAMELLATDTGGEALYASNRLSEDVARAIQNSSHYYTLVYTPPSTQMDGKFHRIQVKLTEGKAKLSYRRGYYADLASAVPLPSDPLAPLLAHGMPASTQILYKTRILPLSPQPAPGAVPAGGNAKLPPPVTRVKVDYVIDAATIALDSAPDGTHTGRLEVALVAHTPNGEIANWTGQTLAISLNDADYAKMQQSGIPIHLLIDLPQTGLFLSTGVYDLNAHKAGTMEIPLQPESAAGTP